MASFSQLPIELQLLIFEKLADAEYSAFPHHRIIVSQLLVSGYEHILSYRLVCRRWRNLISDMDRSSLQDMLPHLRRLHSHYHEIKVMMNGADNSEDESDGFIDVISATDSAQYAALLDRTREVLVKLYGREKRFAVKVHGT